MIVEGVYLYNIMMQAVPNYLRKPGRDIMKYDAPIKSNHLMDTTSHFAPWDLNKALSTPVKVSIVSCFWSPSSWTGIPLSVNVLKTNHIHNWPKNSSTGDSAAAQPASFLGCQEWKQRRPQHSIAQVQNVYTYGAVKTTALCAASIRIVVRKNTSLLTPLLVVPPKKKRAHVLKTVKKGQFKKKTYSTQHRMNQPTTVKTTLRARTSSEDWHLGCQENQPIFFKGVNPKYINTEFAIITWNHPKK